MSGIDESLNFVPLAVAVLTVSDTRTRENDTSGDILEERIKTAGHQFIERKILRDDIQAIQTQIAAWSERDDIDVVITTGGTGLTGRDVTPEAVRPILDKEIEGFSVVFHNVSYQTIGLSTLQSRAFAGLVKGTVVFCLPGSNGAVKDGWDKVISFQLDRRYRPCNLVEIMPRFCEA